MVLIYSYMMYVHKFYEHIFYFQMYSYKRYLLYPTCQDSRLIINMYKNIDSSYYNAEEGKVHWLYVKVLHSVSKIISNLDTRHLKFKIQKKRNYNFATNCTIL